MQITAGLCHRKVPGADPGEVKRVNFHPPFSEPPCFFFLFLIPQILIGSNTLLQKFTPHFKILDPRLGAYEKLFTQPVQNFRSANFSSIPTFPTALS